MFSAEATEERSCRKRFSVFEEVKDASVFEDGRRGEVAGGQLKDC